MGGSESLAPTWPPAAVDPTRTKVLLALVHLYALHGRVTIREVASAAGLSLEPTHNHLRALRDEGLVAWDDDTKGTLRPLVSEVYR